MKSFDRPCPRQLRIALQRTPKPLWWACRGAYRASTFVSSVEDSAARKLRTLKAIAHKRQRQVRRWTDARPYLHLAFFPLWATPALSRSPPRYRCPSAFLAGLALVTVATRLPGACLRQVRHHLGLNPTVDPLGWIERTMPSWALSAAEGLARRG